jgi:hypothetical protein
MYPRSLTLTVSFLLLSLLSTFAAVPNNWTAGSYDVGSLVIHEGTTYIASQAVTPSEGNPTAATAYWSSLDALAGTKSTPTGQPSTTPDTSTLSGLNVPSDSNDSSGRFSFSSGDVLIENTSTGARASWSMFGAYRQFMTEDVLLTGGATVGTYATTTEVVGSGDFDGDGKVDLVAQDSSSGLKSIWFMNGSIVSSTLNLTTTATSINVSGVADFNSDGKLDLVLDNTSTGEKSISFLTGTGTSLSVSSTTTIVTDSGYRIVGTGDFNSDSKPDLLVEQTTTSTDPSTTVTRDIWLMDGGSRSSAVNFLTFAQEWSMVGTGDFDNDGRVDVMVEQTTGRKGVWYMNGISIREGFVYATLLPEWSTACSGDLNADGSIDTVFRNSSTGKVILLNLGNQTGALNSFGAKYAYQNVNRDFLSAGTTGADTNWKMRGFIDYDADGSLEILADNMNTGERAVWAVSSSGSLTATIFTTVGTEWRMVGTGAFGGDSTPDILVENTTTGAKSIWVMAWNGTTLSVASGSTFATNANYRIVGTGDFNSDSKIDVVVEQITTDPAFDAAMARQIWFMDGGTKTSEHTFLTFKQEWRIRGVKDFDGNGTPDMLIEQDGSGRRGVWYLTGQSLTEGFIFTTVAPEWQLSLQ